MESTVIKSRPIRDKIGQVLNDLEFAKAGLRACEEYERANHTPAPISPTFRVWLKEMVTACEQGGETPSSYKARTVVRDLPLDLLSTNTLKRNKKGV